MRPMRQPVLAIVGRPNVGKSTLFNRLAGRSIAIVEDLPGVTRDRIYADCTFDVDNEDVCFTVIDTGGFEPEPSSPLFAAVREQTELAIQEADVIVHVVDIRQGVSPDDIEVARMLRKSGRPLLLAANKSDHEKIAASAGEFYELGVTEVFPVSASHGIGVAALLEAAYAKVPSELQEGARDAARRKAEEEEERDGTAFDDALDEAEAALDDETAEPPKAHIVAVPEVLRLAVVGRPNAGKSSFINKLLGEERHLVSDIPGTTMDAIDSFVEYGNTRWRLIDTAGIRRKRSISARVEKYAVVAALRGMYRSDLVLHLIDATAGITEQDMKMASFAEDKGKAVVLVVNKWDLSKDKNLDAEVYATQVRDAMPFLSHAPIRFVSAKTGKRVHDVLGTARDLAERHFLRVSTGEVNRVLKAATDAHQPPMHKGHRTKLLFATQVRTAPPTFVIATNDPDGVHVSYRRYLVNRFREAFDFGGAPVRILYRKRDSGRRPRRKRKDGP